MQLFSTDPNEPGVIAVGQLATGIFAFGQGATGIIAIGQMARGVIVVGQLAIGFVAIGQLAIGIFYAVGMIGVGGRGAGLVLTLLPKLVKLEPQRPHQPPLTTLARLYAEGGVGHVHLHLDRDGRLFDDDGREAEILLAEGNYVLADRAASGHTDAYVRVTVQDRDDLSAQSGYRKAAPMIRELHGDQVRTWEEHRPRWALVGPFTNAGGILVRAGAMAAITLVWWFFVGLDLVAMFG